MSYDTEFLYQGFMGDRKQLRALQRRCRFTDEEAAAFCLVSVETYRRWLRDRPANRTALRLLAIRAGILPWEGWDRWEMQNSYLFPPGFTRHGIGPGDIHSTIFLKQLVTEQRKTIENLELIRRQKTGILSCAL